jgi:hypothetical protein
MCLTVAGLEHGHRRLVGMQKGPAQQFRSQRVHKRLQLHAALSDHTAQVWSER